MALWMFWIYSFLGYLLEKVFAKVTCAKQQGRKGFLLLPLCPVYGLGMLAVLALPPEARRGAWLVVWGALAATAVEYAVHWAYDTALGVRFWDYSGTFGNLRGRVCLPFTAAWGVLTALAVQWVQPEVERLARRVPPEVTLLCFAVFAADALCSVRVLRRTGDAEALRCDRWNMGKAL
ncbi:MAG: hypothetical protein E7429_06975 [Ruminococcaceae bacterium]|nr:hypothetical protein [Oscillospiraceae bacterium]